MVNVFAETTVAILNPLQAIWLKFVEVIPNLVGATIVLIIGVFVASILGHALRVILEKTRLDAALRKAKLTRAVGHTNVPSLLGELLKWYIIIIFLQAAVSLVNLGTISTLLNSFVLWLPSLLVAVIIMLVGLAGAHYVQHAIEGHTKLKGMRFTGKVLKWVIIILVGLVALREVGIDVSVLENTFLLVIGALAGGFALALGISLGLGMKKSSENFIKNIKKGI